MKRAEKQGKPHFNVVDAVIVILVIAALVGVYFRYNIMDYLTQASSKSEYYLTFTVEDVRYTTPYYIEMDDVFYLSANGDELGVFAGGAENQSEPIITFASKTVTDSKGEIHEISYPHEQSRVNINGRLLCYGTFSEETGFCLDGKSYFGAGESVSVYSEKVTFTLRILSIESVS